MGGNDELQATARPYARRRFTYGQPVPRERAGTWAKRTCEIRRKEPEMTEYVERIIEEVEELEALRASMDALVAASVIEDMRDAIEERR